MANSSRSNRTEVPEAKAAMDNARGSVIMAGMYRDDCCKTDEEALDFLNTKFANAKDNDSRNIIKNNGIIFKFAFIPIT